MPRFRIVKKGSPTPPPPPPVGYLLGANIAGTGYPLDNVVLNNHSASALAWTTMPGGAAVPSANLTADGRPNALPGGATAWRRVCQLPEPVAGSPPQMAITATPGAIATLTASGATLDSFNGGTGIGLVTPAGAQPGGGAFNLDMTLTSAGALVDFDVRPVGAVGRFAPSFLAQIAAETTTGSFLRPSPLDITGPSQSPDNFGISTASPGAQVSLSTRNTLNTAGDWFPSPGAGGTRKNDGWPFELLVEMCVATQRGLHHSFQMNLANDLIDFYADYAADNLCNLGYIYAPELGNENWNFPNANNQLRLEAIANSLAGIDGTPGGGGPLERAIERSIEVFLRMKARFALRSSAIQALLQPVFAWQNLLNATDTGRALDYAPPGKTALKNHIKFWADAPYFGNTFGDPDRGNTREYDWWAALWNEADAAISTFAAAQKTACDARGITMMHYEIGQSILINDPTLNATLQGGVLMQAGYQYAFDQDRAVIGNIPANHYLTVGPLNTAAGSWGAKTASMYTEATSSPNQPKARELKNQVLGTKALYSLVTDLYFVVGDPNGTLCGKVAVGRSWASALALSDSRFAINSTTGNVTIANSGALSSGANSVDITETLAGYSGSPKSTTVNIQGYTLSAELLTNGNLSSAGPPPTNLESSHVTISGGKATCTGATQMLSWAGVCTAGQRYRYSFDYNRTGGQDIRLSNSATVATNVVKTIPLSAGAHTVSGDFLATGTAFTIEASGAIYSGDLDNISLKHLV